MTNTVCHICGNKYTNLEIDYCMGCGAVIGKKRAEYLGEPYTRWEKFKDSTMVLGSKIKWPKLIVMPYYDLTIVKPQISPKFGEIWNWIKRQWPKFDYFAEDWRNSVVNGPAYHHGQTCRDPISHGCGLPKKYEFLHGKKTYHEKRVDNKWITVDPQHDGKPLPRKLGDVVLAGDDNSLGVDISPIVDDVRRQVSAGPIHGKDQVVIIRVDGKEHRIDYVQNFNMITRQGNQVTSMGSPHPIGMSGPTTTSVTLDVLMEGVSNMSFWQSLIGAEVELLIVDARDGYRHKLIGSVVSFNTVGKAGEYNTARVEFMVREQRYVNYTAQQAHNIAGNQLIERLEKEYPFLTMKDHPCDNYEMEWEEIGDHVVCTLCGRMMATNLPIPVLPPANAQTIVLGNDTRPYNHNTSDPVGIAMKSGEDGDQIPVYTGSGTIATSFIERMAPVVRKPSAAVKL